jgi:hypothetical protein
MPQHPRTPLRPNDRQRLTERASPELGTSRPTGFRFTEARHGLTAAQVVQANQALRRLEHTRPIRERGARGTALRALRIAGIVSSVKGGRIAASGWGRRMLATKGGNALRDHALDHLQQWSPIASLAAMMARERTRALAHFDATGNVLAPGERPAPSPEERRIQEMTTLWEEQQWQTQQADRLRW